VKILFINPLAELGGAERSLLDLIRSLREKSESAEVTVCAFSSGPLLDAVRSMGCEALLVPLPAALARLGDSAGDNSTRARTVVRGIASTLARGPAFVWRLRREIDRVGPDIVHTNGFKAHLFGALVRSRGTRLVWHLRDFVRSRPILRLVLPLAARRADLAIAISEAVAADARALLPLRVVTLLNAIDTSHFAPGVVTPLDLDQAAGLSPAPNPVTRVGLVATYAWWKGHEVFLRAASHLSGLPIRFYIIGGALYSTAGSQRTLAELRALISELGLTRTTGLVPFQSDPRSAYLALDVVVHASTAPEPFGRTIAEAMSCGRAVIASAAGGAGEQIADGRTGLLVPPNDPEALAQRIGSLHESPERRASLGSAARASAVSLLDSSRLGPATLAWYHEICQAPRQHHSRTRHLRT